MIMACGTGKTFTSLQIAQEMTPKGGTVLFLVPSLALLSQTLKEWKREASINFRAYAVCSDSKLSKQASTEDTRVADLAYPSTTSVEKLAAHFSKGTDAGLTVVFSTYQSIDVVAQAQGKGLPEFDLIVCDEAHRTTGVTLVDEDESAFVRVHDNNFIKGSKRLYMTATPRIFAEATKAKAEDASAVIASMDDETKFGGEFHRLNFGNAVSRGLLSDYKVLVLTVSETQVSKSLQKILTDGDELKLQDAIKIVGCYNGLRTKKTS
jgi:predicted helicase